MLEIRFDIETIIDKLTNNEEFLRKVAENIPKEYFKVNQEHIFNENQQIVVDCENDQENIACFDEQKLKELEEKYQTDLAEKNGNIIDLNREIVDLKIEINQLNEEKTSIVQNNNKLEEILNNIKMENTKLNELNNQNNQEINDLKKEKEDAEKVLYYLKNQNKNLLNDLNILKDKYDEIKSREEKIIALKNKELEDKELELKEKDSIILKKDVQIQNLQSEFSSMRDAYNLFLDLDEDIKKDIISLLRGSKIENFVYAGIQYKNIEFMWEYAKNRAISGQIKDLDKLEKIIMNFLNTYNMLYKSPVYGIQNVENGDKFDEEKYTRGYESNIRGIISNVDLRGYVNLINGKIIKKSVVRI